MGRNLVQEAKVAERRSQLERCKLSDDPDELREWIGHLQIAISWAIDALDANDGDQAPIRAQLEKMLYLNAGFAPEEMAAEWSHEIYELLLPVTQKLRDAEANGFEVRLRGHGHNFVVEVRPKVPGL